MLNFRKLCHIEVLSKQEKVQDLRQSKRNMKIWVHAISNGSHFGCPQNTCSSSDDQSHASQVPLNSVTNEHVTASDIEVSGEM